MSSHSLPSTTKAIVSRATTATLEASWPVHNPLPPTYLLVKVHSIALNPTDWKHLHWGLGGPDPVIIGCDYAGTVVQVGEGVTKSFSPGDRVTGCGHGSNQSQPWSGVFASYALVKGDLAMKIPSSLTFEQAATFPLGVSTVGQGLYQKALKLRLPYSSSNGPEGKNEAEAEWVLIYGGSSATGSLGIQFAKASGYRVVTTSSPRNFDFVLKDRGADAVFDYNDPACGQKINQLTGNKLRLAWDTISLPASAAICSAALSTDPSLEVKYGSILPAKLPEPQPNGRKVTEITTLMYTIFNEPYAKAGRETPAIPEDFEFAKKFFDLTERLIKDGKLKTHPEKIGPNGLRGALDGLKDMQQEKVSGQKLVYRVDETPDEALGTSVDFK
ncbi:hypothetical protein DV736_g3003, partial [Chaetothyriales sp. CBS 134916]